MEVYYQNEGFHQYLVLTSDTIAEEGYEIQMLMQFHGSCLLPVHMYGQNEQIRFSYDITGMSDLVQMTRDRELDGQFLKNLFAAIWTACDELEEYLLSTDALILDPKLIYYHPGRSKLRFCYLPGQTEDFGHNFLRLTEFCLKYTDHTDEAAVIYIYGLYRHIQTGSLSREELQSYLSGSVSDHGMSDRCGIEAEPVPDVYDQTEDRYATGETSDPPDRKKDKWIVVFYGVLGALCILAIMFFVLRYILYDHSDRDLKLVIILAVILLLDIYSIFRSRAGSTAFRSKSETTKPTGEALTVVSKENVSIPEVSAAGAPIRETSVLTSAFNGAVLNSSDSTRNCQWILKSIISENPDITLYRLPGVIGRQQDCDYVLPKSGVSRRHAMIYESGKEIYIEDLGSTNGTYIDEVRLSAGEPMCLNEDVILRVGTEQYRVIRRSHIS